MDSPVQEEDLEHCVKLLREHAHDFYLADLLLPPDIRPNIFVLHAFHVEIGNIVLATREPAMGEIRFQWWSEVINGEREGEAQGHPVARALLAVIEKYNLPKSAFDQKLQAHEFDLYNDPMESRQMLEGYFGETRSMLFQLAGIIAGAEDITALAEASGHAGVATGGVWMLESLAHHKSKGQIYVPGDLIKATGLEVSNLWSADQSSKNEQIIIAIADMAQEHQNKFITANKQFSGKVRSVFNLTALNPLYLKRIRKNPHAALKYRADLPQLRRQWALFRY